MRAHRRMGASIAGVIGALMIASSALGASPWLSLRQQGVTAVSVHLACVDGRAGTLRCEAEILQAFTGRLKITGSRTEHAQLVCYQKLEATVDPETGETIDAHGVFGCSFDRGTLRTMGLSSIVLRPTAIELSEVSCDESGCSEAPAGTVTVRARWTGVGRTTVQRERFHASDEVCSELDAMQVRGRDATFSGVVGGTAIASDNAAVGAGTFRLRTDCLQLPPGS